MPLILRNQSTGSILVHYSTTDDLILAGSTDVNLNGKYGLCVHFDTALPGRHRIANDDLTLYEIYKGEDEAADLTAAAWETFATLPHDTAAIDLPGAGDTKTIHLVVRARNAYDLVSQNIYESLTTIDENGALVSASPSAPAAYAIAAAAGGTMTITAHYPYLPDGTDAADTWALWITSNGDVPDPDAAADDTVTMVKTTGVARLSYTTEAFDDAATIKAIVRTRRAGAPDYDSANTTIVSAVADTDGPAAVAMQAHYQRTAMAHHITE